MQVERVCSVKILQLDGLQTVSFEHQVLDGIA
jgi:hypothetical protein